LLGAIALACLSVPVLAVPTAYADTVVVNPSNSGYFFQFGVDKPEASPAAPPNVGNDIDGVSTGHIAVSALLGMENKVSFLFFDVFDIPADATVEKAVVSLPLVPMDPPNDLVFQAAPENVAACMAGDEGFTGDDAVGLAKAPARLCDKFKAVGTLSKDGKAYEFNITALAASWLSGVNDGVAFTAADTGPSSSFQVVFDQATSALSLSYSTPDTGVDEDPGTLPDGSGTPPTDGTGTGGGGAPPDLGGVVTPPGFGSDPGVGAPPTTGGGTPPVTSPQGGAQPANIALAASSRPTNSFWLGVLALVAALVVISLVCGDPGATGNQRKTTRLAKALSHRQGLLPRPVSW
jgi:hypothetical protein